MGNPALATSSGHGRLAGKVAIVVGAGSSGADVSNGSAAAIVYAREGARVLCVDRDTAAAQRVVKQIRETGGNALPFEADVCSKDQLAAMASYCASEYGRIDVLHNNVGIEIVAELENIREEDWDRVFDINLKGVMLACQQVIPRMVQQGGGSIVNISSIASRKWSPMPFLAYNTSKAALNHMTRVLARRYAPNHVRANVVVPGLIDTPHAAHLTTGDAAAVQAARDARNQRCPMGHQGTAWDVAYASLFLASDESRYITGTEITVDGGLYL
ncbi:SDR family NAD(P)-dependent oxidoreductase [Cupriavidus sp. GA3-3]|uniref:SDR family NAD(P)-dependent oxidoreductase n=1 Tax=Cupriavidus TaxID=106589 RepID=UPI0003A54918|nr:SDR family oxidoreductase [Cupriavidus sp. GA3-3]